MGVERESLIVGCEVELTLSTRTAYSFDSMKTPNVNGHRRNWVCRPSGARNISSQMLGHCLRTEQSSGNGLRVNKLYATEHVNYKTEYYLALTIDREAFAPVLIVSRQGGMDVEETTGKPDAFPKVHIDHDNGVTVDTVSRVSQVRWRWPKRLRDRHTDIRDDNFHSL